MSPVRPKNLKLEKPLNKVCGLNYLRLTECMQKTLIKVDKIYHRCKSNCTMRESAVAENARAQGHADSRAYVPTFLLSMSLCVIARAYVLARACACVSVCLRVPRG